MHTTSRPDGRKVCEPPSAQKPLASCSPATTPFRGSQFNLALGHTYLNAHDPSLATREWSEVMEQMIANGGREATQRRCRSAFKHPAFDLIRHRKLYETTSDDFLRLLRSRCVSVAHYLRRLHNLAIKYGWLVAPILPPKGWPRPTAKPKRAITRDEHERILTREPSQEWRTYYELLWELGTSQTDGACLEASNIDWPTRTLSYQRRKLGLASRPALISIGPKLEALLCRLPAEGPLFPTILEFNDGVRAWHFARRCRRAKVRGVTLHSYRYAWAERAAKAGYPERWAQAALGHNSRAVHQAYAKRALVVVPPLDTYEAQMAESAPARPLPASPGH